MAARRMPARAEAARPVTAAGGRARSQRLWPWLALLAVTGSAQAQQPEAVPREDGASVPLMVYHARADACQGVAIVSPGAGGTERGYAYLGEALAAMGHLAVVVGHAESGPGAVRERLRSAAGLREALGALITDPNAYRARSMDIAAASRWARAHCPGGPAWLLGHSMGAATAMIEAGAGNHLGLRGRDGFDLYIVLSPQGAGSIFPAGAWSGIQRPVLSITGTRDDELHGGSWQTRTEPYRNMAPGCKWLAVIEQATHMNLAGHGASQTAEALVKRSIAAFAEGVRRGDCQKPPATGGMSIEAR